MSINLTPTKIKQSIYLLVPKKVAELVEINDNTTFSLSIKKTQNKNILEYKINDNETK